MQKICIIIPCYNEAQRFNQSHFVDFINENKGYDFCLVNDGSSDETQSILEQLVKVDENRICCLHLKENVGKGEAIRNAILFSVQKGVYEYIGFIDADFSAPLSEINHLLFSCNGQFSHSIIAGSRVKRLGATIVRDPSRHYLGRVFATVAGIFLGLPIYDSQCGLKFIRIDAAKVLFMEPFLTKWLFDLELWLRLRNLRGSDAASFEAIEIPLTEWKEKGGSKIKLKHFFRVPIDLIRIYLKYNRKRLAD